MNAIVDSRRFISEPPNVDESALFGSLLDFRWQPLQFLLRIAEEYGDISRFRLGPMRVTLLRHPDFIKHVLVDNHRNYDKQTRGFEGLRMFLGKGLLTNDGESWQRQRRLMQPAFHKQRIAAFADIMVAKTNDMLERWESHARAGKAISITDEMSNLTLALVMKTLLGTEMDAQAVQIQDPLAELQLYVNGSVTNPLQLPWPVPTPANLRVRRAAQTMDRVIRDIIAKRKASGGGADLLSMLIEARDEQGNGMSDQQLRDEALTFFLAGHETTANALAWTFHLLSTHPHVERRMRAEINEVLGDRPATMADVPTLRFTEMVIKESMRLFPPAWVFDRRSREEDVIGGYRIKPNTFVLLSPYVTHRHAAFWPNPEGFDPDRFAPEIEATRPRYAYFPFGGGPRQCIGNAFAMMEAVLVLATVTQRFSLWQIPDHSIEPDPLVTMRPKGGIRMGLQPLVRRAA